MWRLWWVNAAVGLIPGGQLACGWGERVGPSLLSLVGLLYFLSRQWQRPVDWRSEPSALVSTFMALSTSVSDGRSSSSVSVPSMLQPSVPLPG